MVNQAVAECYATLVDPFGSTAGRPSPHRGADYKRSAGQTIVAYEDCTVIDSDLKSQYLGYSLTAKRHRDGKVIGWAHIRQGTRPGNGTVLKAGDQVGLVAGWDDFHGSSWSGPHIHTTEGDGAESIYSGQNSDPAPDIAAAVRGSQPGSGNASVNYHWYKLSGEAMGALQEMLAKLGKYSGPIDNDFGENSVKALQQQGKDWGYLPGDYEADGIPHNPDQEAPSNYGFFLQQFAKNEGGYTGDMDGLPAGMTSEALVRGARKIINQISQPAPTPAPQPTPTPAPSVRIPSAPEGYVFFPDLGTSQGDFNFADYAAAGGRHVALKFGGGNASDSPYIAPRYKDQLDRARAQQQEIIHYWFNGRRNGLTPEASADFMANKIDLKQGEIIAIDVEDEEATATKAWSPGEVASFITQLRKHFPGIKGLVYMSDSLADSGDWRNVVSLGWELWNASWGANNGDPGTPPSTDDWSYYTVWQYSSNEKVPGNGNGNTDGNLGKIDTWSRLGWKVPVVTTPTPDPTPTPTPVPDVPETVSREAFFNFLADMARLTSEHAVAIRDGKE